MIAVYPYKHNGRHDHELRFSLRSLAKHGKWCDGVLLIGDKPEWYTGHHIGHEGDKDNRLLNVQEKLAIACHAMDVEFWALMNDDMYLLVPQSECQLLRGPPIGETWQSMAGRYRKALQETELIVGSKFPSLELHCPFPVVTTYMREALELCAGKALHRTVCGWIAQNGEWGNRWKYDDEPPGGIGRFSEDFKAHTEGLVEQMFEKPWFSSREATSIGLFQRRMPELFPEPSPWEAH